MNILLVHKRNLLQVPSQTGPGAYCISPPLSYKPYWSALDFCIKCSDFHCSQQVASSVKWKNDALGINISSWLSSLGACHLIENSASLLRIVQPRHVLHRANWTTLCELHLKPYTRVWGVHTNRFAQVHLCRNLLLTQPLLTNVLPSGIQCILAYQYP